MCLRRSSRSLLALAHEAAARQLETELGAAEKEEATSLRRMIFSLGSAASFVCLRRSSRSLLAHEAAARQLETELGAAEKGEATSLRRMIFLF